MRYKHIMTVFLLCVPAAVVARAIQLFKTTDYTTGFTTNNKLSLIVTSIISLITIINIGCCVTVKRAPLKSPKVRPRLGVAAFLMIVAIPLDVLAAISHPTINGILKISTIVLGIATVCFFAAYGFKAIKKYRLEKLLYVIPAIFFAFKLIVSFVSIAPLALISTNAYMILALAATTLFFFEFAKIANGYDKDKSYKKILITGTLTVLFNAVASIPDMLLLLGNMDALEHREPGEMFGCLLIAVFTLIYLFEHFSNKNLKDRRYRQKNQPKKEKFLRLDRNVQEFYYGDNKD